MIASYVDHTNAILAALEAHKPGLWGDAVNPAGRGWQGTPGSSNFLPYGVVFMLTAMFDGPIGAPNDDSDFIFQVTCVGSTRKQAEWVADQVNLAVQTVTVTGRSIQAVDLDQGGGFVRRDDTEQPPLFITTPRFRIKSND